MIEDIFRLRVTARDGVADDHEVGFRFQILFRVPVHDGDILGGEKRRHRLIDILVGAGDGKALVEHRGSSGRHGRAADAGEMDGFDLG